MFEIINNFFFSLRYARTELNRFTSGNFQHRNRIENQGNTFMLFLHFFLLHIYTLFFKFKSYNTTSFVQLQKIFI